MNKFELKQRRICNGCKALIEHRPPLQCEFNYKTKNEYIHTRFGNIHKSIPLEPCPKPITIDNYIYVRSILKN